MSTRTLTIASTAELAPLALDYACTTLGRLPLDCVVCVHVNEEGKLGPVSSIPRRNTLAAPAAPEGYPFVIVAEFGDPDQDRDPRAGEGGFCARNMAAKYRAADVQILDVIVFDGVTAWRSLSNQTSGRHTLGTSALGGTVPTDDVPSVPTPTGSDSLAVEVTRAADRLEAAPDQAEAIVGLLTYARWRRFLEGTLTDEDRVVFLALMRQPLAVALFLRMMTTFNLPQISDDQPLLGHFPNGIEWDMADACTIRLKELGDAAPPAHVHGPVVLMAWLEWYRGRGTRAQHLLDALDQAHAPNVPIPALDTVAPVALDPQHAYRPTA